LIFLRKGKCGQDFIQNENLILTSLFLFFFLGPKSKISYSPASSKICCLICLKLSFFFISVRIICE
ncbi:hypothetical protein AB4K20DRAFT_1906983, partial [Rhizopus microsporus]